MNWFLYDNGLLHERVKKIFNSKHGTKLKIKAKETERRKTKIQKQENLVLPKE